MNLQILWAGSTFGGNIVYLGTDEKMARAASEKVTAPDVGPCVAQLLCAIGPDGRAIPVCPATSYHVGAEFSPGQTGP